MASHEATEIPQTHQEEAEEPEEATLISQRDSAASSNPGGLKTTQEESRAKRIEHEAEYALEEGIEAATGRGFQTSASLDTNDAQAATGEQSSMDGRDNGAQDQDLEAQDGQQTPPGKGKGRKEVELQDQTNLLPVRQVIVVFAGLSAALFCSLLDQTMYVSHLICEM